MTISRLVGLRRTGFARAERKEAATIKKIRAKKCAVKTCRAPFTPDRPFIKWCSPECGSALALALKAKAERKVDKVRKDALKGLRDWIADTQVAFNAFVRGRDAMRMCISCPTHLPTLAGASGGWFDCGHYRSRGSAPHLRFDERNAHGQCKQCNRYRSGNAADYRIGLIARIGLAAVEALESDDTPRKYSIGELKAIKATYVLKLKQLKGK